jgi:hypothetical protein
MLNDRYFCPILTKTETSRQILVKLNNIKFHEQLSVGLKQCYHQIGPKNWHCSLIFILTPILEACICSQEYSSSVTARKGTIQLTAPGQHVTVGQWCFDADSSDVNVGQCSFEAPELGDDKRTH